MEMGAVRCRISARRTRRARRQLSRKAAFSAVSRLAVDVMKCERKAVCRSRRVSGTDWRLSALSAS